MRTGLIVVVEDERPQRETLAQALREKGHRVLEAENAADAKGRPRCTSSRRAASIAPLQA